MAHFPTGSRFTTRPPDRLHWRVWSALAESTYQVGTSLPTPADLAVSEISYFPQDPNGDAEFFSSESCLPENRDDGKKGEVKVAVWSAPVSETFAKRMRAIWNQMLTRTRPPDKPNSGVDDETIEFATPGHTGETWTPMQRKSPAFFGELGRSLAKYCMAAPEKRAPLMEVVEQRAKVLEDYLRDHPVK